MVNPLEAVIMHSMGDYMNLKSVNVTKEDARLSLIRIIVYLESHPEIPGECVTILWSVLKHITASGQDGEISDVLASERSSDNVDNDEQVMGSGQDGKISCVNASECSSDYNGVCNDQQGICERDGYECPPSDEDIDRSSLSKVDKTYLTPIKEVQPRNTDLMTLPKELLLKPSSINPSRCGVFTSELLASGATFGPFVGDLLRDLGKVKEKRFCWKLYKGSHVHYLDGSDKALSNWMLSVQQALSAHDCNTEVVQEGESIFYRTLKAIDKGDELLLQPGRHHVVVALRRNVTHFESAVQHNKILSMTEVARADAAKPKVFDHSYSEQSTGEYVCPVCNKLFPSVATLKKHMMIIHGDGARYKCKQCDKLFKNPTTLKHHKLIHSGEKPFPCLKCGKRFRMSSHLKMHDRTHTGEKPHICTVCGKQFSILANQKEHLLIHTGERPHACPICEKRFANRSNFNQHKKRCQRMHTGDDMNDFLCDTCGATFKRIESFHKHILSHTGDKKYRCTSCPEQFVFPADLQKHIRVHAGERPYKCRRCNKECTNKDELKAHLRTHTAAKLYQCSICNERFTCKKTFLNHKRSQCTDCLKCFQTVDELHAHSRNHSDEKLVSVLRVFSSFAPCEEVHTTTTVQD